jgi:hypothetical protein
VGERRWPRRSVNGQPILLLVIAYRLLGARPELAIGAYAKFLLKLLHGIAARALFEKNKLIEIHCNERIGPGDAFRGKTILFFRLPFLQRLFRVRAEFAVGLDS